jgi:hypothetical protein
MLICRRHTTRLAAVFLGVCALPAYTAAPSEATTTTAQAAGSDNAPALLEQFHAVSRQTEIAHLYNQHLQALLNSQAAEKKSLEQQLVDVEVTKQEILPLILRMLTSFEQFVQLDKPFLPPERKQRLQQLKDLVVTPDVSTAEKFRRIMEAFQIENEYGKTIEAYKGDIDLNGKKSSVDFLRLGRVSLFYQRLDGSETGYWDSSAKQWQQLSSDYASAIRKGLRIARKETAPDMLIIPVSAPEAAQ